eukprot:1183108-Prorocentrum_minimum.AAC.2
MASTGGKASAPPPPPVRLAASLPRRWDNETSRVDIHFLNLRSAYVPPRKNPPSTAHPKPSASASPTSKSSLGGTKGSCAVMTL